MIIVSYAKRKDISPKIVLCIKAKRSFNNSLILLVFKNMMLNLFTLRLTLSTPIWILSCMNLTLIQILPFIILFLTFMVSWCRLIIFTISSLLLNLSCLFTNMKSQSRSLLSLILVQYLQLLNLKWFLLLIGNLSNNIFVLPIVKFLLQKLSVKPSSSNHFPRSIFPTNS